MGSSKETVAALRYARGKDEAVKAHIVHCALGGCQDCVTLKYAARVAWQAWSRSKAADAAPSPGQAVLF